MLYTYFFKTLRAYLLKSDRKNITINDRFLIIVIFLGQYVIENCEHDKK